MSARAAPPAQLACARAGSRGRRPSARLRSPSPLLRPSTPSAPSAAGAAKALREGVASPLAARPVPPSVSPREEPPSGALRGDSSRGRPSAGACEEAPGRSHVQSPPATHSLPALLGGGPAAGGRRGARPQHEPQPPARGGQRLPGHHGGEEQVWS